MSKTTTATKIELTGDYPDVKEDFAKLLDEQLGENSTMIGKVTKGRIVNVENDFVIVDVGLKSEGRIPMKEFGSAVPENLKAGDEVDVYIERFENQDGEAVLSRERARREEVWVELEKSYEKEEPVTGIIFNRVKGGFTVDVSGAIAFLPSSQLDIRPVKNTDVLMNKEQPFMILKMDRKRGNIVVSRRAILEESRAEARDELINEMREGLEVEGVVKNITDYGAFIDLGGVDGLLHLTDMSWKRINHPSEMLNVGDTIKVQVIKYNEENKRISLGMKQLEDDPWQGVAAKYPINAKFKGRVTNIADYGAFVELEEGIEGLVHVSEMSWTNKNLHPGKILSTSQEVDVMVLEVDADKRRISLGLKQCSDNPWDTFMAEYPEESELEGEIKNITDFGLFVDLPHGLDGMVHMSDIDWSMAGEEAIKEYNKNDKVKVKILDIDATKERISLGIKQLTDDPFASSLGNIKKGQVVTCTITAIKENAGIEVDVNGSRGFIRKSDLARDRSEQRPDRFAVGEKVDALVQNIDKKDRQLILSIKAREISEEKEAMKEYGSTDSGAQLGDILGGVLGQAKEQADKKSQSEPKKPEPKKAESKKSEKAAKEPAKKETKSKAKDTAEDKADKKDAKKATKSKAAKTTKASATKTKAADKGKKDKK